jgi:hypothetical protein
MLVFDLGVTVSVLKNTTLSAVGPYMYTIAAESHMITKTIT